MLSNSNNQNGVSDLTELLEVVNKSIQKIEQISKMTDSNKKYQLMVQELESLQSIHLEDGENDKK